MLRVLECVEAREGSDAIDRSNDDVIIGGPVSLQLENNAKTEVADANSRLEGGM
jgi:hypothetical protein